MALRYEHATQDRDRFIARALESFARPVESSLQGSESTIEAAEDRARSRTQRARRVAGEDNEIREIAPDQGEPAVKGGPSGFDPEACGFLGHPAEGDLCCEQTATG